MSTGTNTGAAPRKTKPNGRHPYQALSAAFIRTAPPRRHADGNGLYLFVQPSGIQRLVIRGRRPRRRNHPREVVEAALAHVVRNKVEVAYKRTDLFEHRRRLMDDWASYLAGESRDPEVGPASLK